jgi:predicted Zn-dependent peptidase
VSVFSGQRLGLGVTAVFAALRRDSLVMISATGLRSNAAKLEKALVAELEKLSNREFTADDAREARQNLLSAQVSDGTVEGAASRLALADVLALPAEETDDSTQYAARLLRVVTPEALTTAARQYLAAERASIVVLQPQAAP